MVMRVGGGKNDRGSDQRMGGPESERKVETAKFDVFLIAYSY